ncbi:MAG: sulfurtransferase [Ornithinimicrobium sp.]
MPEHAPPAPVGGPLVEPSELAALLAQPDAQARPVVLDVRWSLGRGVEGNRAEYEAGHVPGAAFVDLETALAGHPRDSGVGGRHPLPRLYAATEALRRAGVRMDRPVVAYDGATSLSAARAWWVLQYFGKDNVRVLNGGYAAWCSAGLPTDSGPGGEPKDGDVELRPGGREAPTADDLTAYLDAPGGRLVDARAPERYRGDVEPMDPIAGHIPGAVNIPTLSALAADGRFNPQALQALLSQEGIDPHAPTALYCGSGVQAAHLALALEVVDPYRRPPAVYVGSWSDWVSDEQRPVATGGAPHE